MKVSIKDFQFKNGSTLNYRKNQLRFKFQDSTNKATRAFVRLLKTHALSCLLRIKTLKTWKRSNSYLSSIWKNQLRLLYPKKENKTLLPSKSMFLHTHRLSWYIVNKRNSGKWEDLILQLSMMLSAKLVWAIETTSSNILLLSHS